MSALKVLKCNGKRIVKGGSYWTQEGLARSSHLNWDLKENLKHEVKPFPGRREYKCKGPKTGRNLGISWIDQSQCSCRIIDEGVIKLKVNSPEGLDIQIMLFFKFLTKKIESEQNLWTCLVFFWNTNHLASVLNLPYVVCGLCTDIHVYICVYLAKTLIPIPTSEEMTQLAKRKDSKVPVTPIRNNIGPRWRKL